VAVVCLKDWFVQETTCVANGLLEKQLPSESSSDIGKGHFSFA
jgi:hypothetical protein